MKTRKRKRPIGDGQPLIPDAPVLTKLDLERFQTSQQFCLFQLSDRIEYCRNRLNKHLPQQMPPLVEDILRYVFHEHKTWAPWKPFDPYERFGVANNSETSSRLSLDRGCYTGFTNQVSLLDGPRKWSCRLVCDTNGYAYIAAGIYNHNEFSKGNLAGNKNDCDWEESIHFEQFHSQIRFIDGAKENRFSNAVFKVSNGIFDTVTIEVFPERKIVRFKMIHELHDLTFDNLSDWRPYVCLSGDVSVEVQEE